MKTRTLIRILLLITGGLCVLSVILRLPVLELYVKPTTVPLFLMLYWFNTKNLDSLFLLVLLLCFLGDVFLLIDIANSFIFVLLTYALCYLLLFYYLYKNHKPLDYGAADIVYLAVFFVVWTYIVYEIYNAIHLEMADLKIYGMVYLVILYFLLLGAVFNYINIRSTKSLWFLMAILNFVISDTCAALHKFYIGSIHFEIINAIYQLLAVFFLVQFKLSSAESLKLKADLN